MNGLMEVELSAAQNFPTTDYAGDTDRKEKANNGKLCVVLTATREIHRVLLRFPASKDFPIRVIRVIAVEKLFLGALVYRDDLLSRGFAYIFG